MQHLQLQLQKAVLLNILKANLKKLSKARATYASQASLLQKTRVRVLQQQKRALQVLSCLVIEGWLTNADLKGKL